MKEGHSTTDFRLELGAMLAEARKQRGLTQKELAEILDMRQPNLSRIEQGKYMSVDALGRYLWPLLCDTFPGVFVLGYSDSNPWWNCSVLTEMGSIDITFHTVLHILCSARPLEGI